MSRITTPDHRSGPKCPVCRMPGGLCICALAPHLNLATRVEAVIHYSDLRRASNSGRLIGMALSNSAIHIRGLPAQMVDLGPGWQGTELVLFPGDDAKELTPEFVKPLARPIRLLVPDGNWNQAAGTVKREARLAKVTKVRLPNKLSAKYRIRHHPDPAKLCTMEAVIRALGVIEGAATETRLESFFDAWVRRILYLKGKISQARLSEGLSV